MVCLLLLSLSLRLGWWGYTRPVPVSDFKEFAILAQDLLEHGQFGYPDPTAYRLPGYPLFLAAMMFVGIPAPWLAVTSILLSAATTYVIHRFALALTQDSQLAITAGVIHSINPTFIAFSPVLAAEHLYVLLVLLAFCSLLTGPHTRRNSLDIRTVLAGILLGGATLTRGEGLFLLPVFLLVILLRKDAIWRRCYRCLLLLVCCAAVVIPWSVRNNRRVGPASGLSTTGGINFYYAHNSTSYGWQGIENTPLAAIPETNRQQAGYRLGMEYLAQASWFERAMGPIKGTGYLYFAPSTYAVTWSSTRLRLQEPTPTAPGWHANLKWYSTLAYGYYILFAAALWGALKLPRFRFTVPVVLCGTAVVNWIGYAVIFWAKSRYRYLPEMMFCILASIPFSSYGSTRRTSNEQKRRPAGSKHST
ncbi:MAG: phospholipid carrier-dependent glycosyltransferase [Verrucomicrobia bacterium]|jgi:4-amino-4-deoxy-L-arabinose transferase-like glycosyltransferase|nr:phospholipid carrier-dependent glycosyltransferase [Verrucomicrobiota bacterium]MBT7064666.1 phospholipid carrier-dependent glycosyltransferase [Verrucomicrobiota bacterium]MBT7700343.1 phospholipid carrier-dependent glycosyltransferase [Verrucomicrobiota bacterium]